MATFKIAQNPTFNADVEIPRVGGEVIQVPFEFKYRDRKGLASLFDSWELRLKNDQEALKAKGESLTIADTTASHIDYQVDQVQDIVAGWGFDDKFSPESIRALVETSAGAGNAIVKAYQDAYTPGRLGN
ncbi:hypothetical protein AQS70_09245 [Pseudomonas endophytica]|uniref:Phage tail assembly chaperone n=1 Tax=Pseudomonas endophytica TaxID=1563157 RepID=A0A0Q0SPP4_9PSED|nr:phage tail assembly chaperone [Pseudomonas endophytica]KQB53787.1 hypothetical protein AQS70_09245 [Pseudomonas endophytica]